MFKYLERLAEIAKTNKEKIAYKVNNDLITYGDLWEKSNVLANISLMNIISSILSFCKDCFPK